MATDDAIQTLLNDIENVYGPIIRDKVADKLKGSSATNFSVPELVEGAMRELGYSEEFLENWFRTKTNSRLRNPMNLFGVEKP